MPRVRRISSRSVAQNEPLPGLSMIELARQRRELGDDLPARLAAHQDAAARPGVADAAPPSPIWRERQRLLAGRSARSGRWPSRVWMT